MVTADDHDTSNAVYKPAEFSYKSELIELQDGFDMRTWGGRLSYFWKLSKPTHILTSDADISAARELVHLNFEANERTKFVAWEEQHNRLLEHQRQHQLAEDANNVKQAWLSTLFNSSAHALWTWTTSSVNPNTSVSPTPPPSIQPPSPSSPSQAMTHVSPKALEEARWVLAGSIHPDSGDTIPLPCRIGTFPIFGSLPVSGLVYFAKYLPSNIMAAGFGQWWNQSQNACTSFVNGATAVGGDEVTSKFVSGYVQGVSVAMALAIGTSVALRRVPSKSAFTKLLPFAPFPAVAAGNVCNTILVRKHELDDGIEVTDIDGNVVGVSVMAAKKAIYETCVTRVLLPAGNFLIAPIVIYPLALACRNQPWTRFPVIAVSTFAVFAAWLPVSLAAYPQRGAMQISELEPNISELTEKAVLYYNKGL
eukprot:m.240373 g.240373  ORF g.240373 m.240373 type:complete len:422 (+) comp33764_c8_seq2:478-1743(+)